MPPRSCPRPLADDRSQLQRAVSRSYDTADPELLAQRLALPQIQAAAPYREKAVVVVNLAQNGDAAQRKASAAYGRAMVGLMAALGHGPAHIGQAVALEADAHFDNVILAYYPGVDYFLDLTSSNFFTGIVGGKQLGDTLAMPTVPIPDRL